MTTLVKIMSQFIESLNNSISLQLSNETDAICKEVLDIKKKTGDSKSQSMT